MRGTPIFAEACEPDALLRRKTQNHRTRTSGASRMHCYRNPTFMVGPRTSTLMERPSAYNGNPSVDESSSPASVVASCTTVVRSVDHTHSVRQVSEKWLMLATQYVLRLTARVNLASQQRIQDSANVDVQKKNMTRVCNILLLFAIYGNFMMK